MEKIAATFTLSLQAKTKLERLKAALRREGIARSVASESAIVDALVRVATIAGGLRAFNV